MPVFAERLSSHCTFLAHDDARILFDCGISEGGISEDESKTLLECDRTYLKRLAELASELTLVVLSHPSPQFIGLFPLLATKFRLSPACMVYASPPTASLGRLAIQEWAYQRSQEEDNGLLPAEIVSRQQGQILAADGDIIKPWIVTPQQISQAFHRVTLLRFNSPSLLAGRNAPLTLLASRAGYSFGGTLWTLRSPTSDDIVYVPVFNHLKEKTVEGSTAITAAAGAASRTQSRGILFIGTDRSKLTSPKSKARNAAILDLINSTLKQSRSIMIPTDASTRVIELLVLLSQHWAFSQIPFPLCLVSHSAKSLPLALSNNLDFLANSLTGAQAKATVEFKNVKRFESLAELNTVIPPTQPRLVLLAPASLAYGYSRAAFADFAEVSGNVVLLTGRGEQGSLAHWLFEQWDIGQDERDTHYGNEHGRLGSIVQLSGSINLLLRHKEYLTGHDLVKHNEAIAVEAERLAKAKALADRRQRVREARDAAESDTSSDEDEAAIDGHLDGTNVGEQTTIDLSNVGDASSRRYGDFADIEGAAAGIGGFDVYVRNAPTRRFPFIERRARVDAYGETIDVAGWMARGKASAASMDQSAATQIALGKRKREEEEEAARIVEDKPHRFVTETRKTNLRCGVMAVDMEGQADGRALKTLVPLMNPRKVVLLGSDVEAIADFQQTCAANSTMTREIYTPSIGKRLQIGEDVRSYTVRLDDNLLSTVPLKKVLDYEVGRVLANVAFTEEASIPSLFASSSTLSAAASGASLGAQTRTFWPNMSDRKVSAMDADQLPPLTAALFIGDVKLATLRSQFNIANIPAAYAGEGVLLCGPVAKAQATLAPGKAKDPRLQRLTSKRAESTPDLTTDEDANTEDRVVVRKEGDGRLLIEGPPGATFFAVRSICYSLHAATA